MACRHTIASITFLVLFSILKTYARTPEVVCGTIDCPIGLRRCYVDSYDFLLARVHEKEGEACNNKKAIVIEKDYIRLKWSCKAKICVCVPAAKTSHYDVTCSATGECKYPKDEIIVNQQPSREYNNVEDCTDCKKTKVSTLPRCLVINCTSLNYETSSCWPNLAYSSHDIESIELLRQYSHSDCNHTNAYSHTTKYMTVVEGCRGSFRVCFREGQTTVPNDDVCGYQTTLATTRNPVKHSSTPMPSTSTDVNTNRPTSLDSSNTVDKTTKNEYKMSGPAVTAAHSSSFSTEKTSKSTSSEDIVENTSFSAHTHTNSDSPFTTSLEPKEDEYDTIFSEGVLITVIVIVVVLVIVVVIIVSVAVFRKHSGYTIQKI